MNPMLLVCSRPDSGSWVCTRILPIVTLSLSTSSNPFVPKLRRGYSTGLRSNHCAGPTSLKRVQAIVVSF
jgi:hypothetical protein